MFSVAIVMLEALPWISMLLKINTFEFEFMTTLSKIFCLVAPLYGVYLMRS